jgi:hypothetical protein
MSDAAFRTIVEILFDEQETTWSAERKVPKKSQDTLMALYKHSKWKWLSKIEDLPKLEGRRFDFSTGKFLMLLPPLEKHHELVPLLHVLYERQEADGDFENACCRILILLLKEDKNNLVGMGFRIESPEMLCQQDEGDFGSHDFYHAQLVREVKDKSNKPIFSSPEWLPDKQPSFPLWAVNPVDALLNLVLTLYGAKWYLEFLSKHGSRIKGISDEFRVLNERLNAKS